MQLSQEQFYQQGAEFIRQILTCLERDSFQITAGSIDHLCYRAATQQSYQLAKQRLELWGDFLSENQIGGRAVAVYLLHQPIAQGPHQIACLELTAPKIGSHYAEGFEHIEVVTEQALAELAGEYPQLDWDCKGANKAINADLRLRYEVGSVKFHNQTLQQVVEWEKSHSSSNG